MSKVSYSPLNWRAAGTTSEPIALAGTTVLGFFTASTLTSTAITFNVCDTIDGTYVPLKNSGGSAISFTVAASGYYGFTNDQLAAFTGVRHVAVVGGSSESAGSQVKLAVREMA